MRSYVAAVALLATAGCASGDAPRTAPTTAPTTTPAVSDVDRVKAALAATRAAHTAHVVTVLDTRLAEGTLTLRREGDYDATARVSSMEQTTLADPPELFGALGIDANAADLTVRFVIAKGASYMQMPAWRGSAHDRWLRFTADDLPKEAGQVDLDASIFPGLVEMLDDAEPVIQRGDDDESAWVAVPASVVFAHYPSSGSTRRLVAAGLDPTQLSKSVAVNVTFAGDLIKNVQFDALSVFEEAWEQVGQEQLGASIDSMPTRVLLTGHGKSVRITVPSGRQVMTADEFEAST